MPAAVVHPCGNATSPWVRVHLDFQEPFIGQGFLTMFDSYSKWLEAYPCQTLTLQCLRILHFLSSSKHEISFVLVSDKGICIYITW